MSDGGDRARRDGGQLLLNLANPGGKLLDRATLRQDPYQRGEALLGDLGQVVQLEVILKQAPDGLLHPLDAGGEADEQVLSGETGVFGVPEPLPEPLQGHGIATRKGAGRRTLDARHPLPCTGAVGRYAPQVQAVIEADYVQVAGFGGIGFSAPARRP